MYVCYICAAPEDQKSVSDPLGLELGMVVNHHAGSDNLTLVLWKSSQ